MLKRISSKRARVFLSVLAVAGITTAAFAYWTAGGSGTGSASADGAQAPLVVNQTVTLDPMYPGDSPQALSGDFDNNNEGPLYVGAVTASIASVTRADGVTGTCDASDFTLANPGMTVDAQVPAGAGVGSFSGATIQFNNKAGTNQNACQGATVELAYTVS